MDVVWQKPQNNSEVDSKIPSELSRRKEHIVEFAPFCILALLETKKKLPLRFILKQISSCPRVQASLPSISYLNRSGKAADRFNIEQRVRTLAPILVWQLVAPLTSPNLGVSMCRKRNLGEMIFRSYINHQIILHVRCILIFRSILLKEGVPGSAGLTTAKREKNVEKSQNLSLHLDLLSSLKRIIQGQLVLGNLRFERSTWPKLQETW